jgi:hypothetical protein
MCSDTHTISDGYVSSITRHKTPMTQMAFELKTHNIRPANFRCNLRCVAVNEVRLEAVTPSFDKPRFRLYTHWGSLYTRVLLGTMYSKNEKTRAYFLF